MQTPVKVSVIMLAYNIGEYIETAIKGVLRQKTSYPFQLVISEDKSTDDTLAICKRYKERYPEQILLIEHEKNLGYQKNYMDGLRHCKGEYIAICDGDDYWIDRNKLQRMTDFMDANQEFAICFHRVINYYEENKSKSLSNGNQKVITNITHLAKSNYITNSSSLFRHSYFKEVPEWFSEIINCDYAMHLLNAQYGNIYYFRKPMAVYRKHKKGIWSVTSEEKRLLTSLLGRERLLEYFTGNKPVYEGLLGAHAQICLALLRFYTQAGEQAKKEELEKRLLSYHPDWTIEEIRRAVIVRERTLPEKIEKGIKTILKKGRETISYLIPLPQVK